MCANGFALLRRLTDREITAMTNTRRGRLIGALLGTGAAFGCTGGGTVNIGSTQAAGGQLSDYAANWDGYVEAYAFQPSGSDRVRLTLDVHGQGTLQVGDGPQLPPATDPNVGYPVGIAGTDIETIAFTLGEGFAYPVHAAQIQSNRIQLGLDPADLFTDWCALQTTLFPANPSPPLFSPTSAADARGPYSCTPQSVGAVIVDGGSDGGADGGGLPCGYTGSDGGAHLVDCNKEILCNIGVCTCTSTACASTQAPAGTSPAEYFNELDGALMDQSMLTGTLNLNGVGRLTVLLQRK